MQETIWRRRKVVVVGAGMVGSTFAYALLREGVAEEIVLLDARRRQAEGQVLDLAHGLPFVPPAEVRAGTQDDYADAQVIVLTAGAQQKPGESRLDLLQRNAAIVDGIVGDIVAAGSRAVLVVVSNPVDVLTAVALRRTGWPRGRVLGSGTVLDSARFRYLISCHCGVDPRNVHAYVLGEHGDSEIAAWSMTHIAGMSMLEYCETCKKCGEGGEAREKARADIARQVRESAYHIIDYKGSTYFAIGLALTRIVAAVLRNERSVLTVSTRLEGEYGFRDVCLSVPCLVGGGGVEKVVDGRLAGAEREGLARSTEVLRQAILETERRAP
jgi:L-lactate dehydrogenase